MKLIYCKNCQDVVRLIEEEERYCKCGECSGQYLDDINAWYKGNAVPIGFRNSSFSLAVQNQPEEGTGEDFTAFVIAKECATFENKDEPWYESEDCEVCLKSAEESGIEYEHNFTWKNGIWVCDWCGQPQ